MGIVALSVKSDDGLIQLTVSKVPPPIVFEGGQSGTRMSQHGEEIPWTVERRMEFIDFRLLWEGQIRRKDITDTFSISVPQASMDLARYDDLAPGNLLYDVTRKTYVASPTFEPKFQRVSADRLLLQFRGLFNGTVERRDTWIGLAPDLGVVPEVRRSMDAKRLRTILTAVRHRCEVDIHYQSFASEEIMWRSVTPHALAFDGFRWHIRAWCGSTQKFKDFVIGRILDLGEMRESNFDPAWDEEWRRAFTLRLAPNPELSTAQKRAVELDYGMTNGVREIPTKIALAFYLIKQLLLDLDHIDPKRQQVIMTNKAEYEREQADAAEVSIRAIQSGARIA